jgi:hypothetical protein
MKAAALTLKEGGGTNREVAKMLYNTRYPTPQQVKNVHPILRAFRKKIAKNSDHISLSPNE